MFKTAVLLASYVTCQTRYAEAILSPDQFNANATGLSGKVLISQQQNASTLNVQIEITGLEKDSFHGIHLHNAAVKDRNCTTTGPHWNPKNVSHGSITLEEHHPGDFGNIKGGADGKSILVFAVNITSISLWGEGDFSPFNRSIVLHAGMDDWGQGGTNLSKTTGNAGARLICGDLLQVTGTQEPIPLAPKEGESPGSVIYNASWRVGLSFLPLTVFLGFMR